MNKNFVLITGPSGSGKSTLGNLLVERNRFSVCRQTTTRQPRSDDNPKYFRYVSHDEFKKMVDDEEFAFFSGDSNEIKKENGKFYGVLLHDIELAFKKSENVLCYVSYKDFQQIEQLKKIYPQIVIFNLTFKDIQSGTQNRLKQDKTRNHTEEDIKRRIQSAVEYDNCFGKMAQQKSITIFTDFYSIEQVYNIAVKQLK